MNAPRHFVHLSGVSSSSPATDEAGRELGIVHRDVSRKNVLLSRLGEVRLADFGIARATQLREQTRGGVRKGTWAYMSPEQVSGQPLTAASDQFSLATLMVELLTGARPFDGPTPLETMDRIREARPPVLENVSPELVSVLRRALAKDPAERFPSSRALRAALQASGPVADELALADHLGAMRDRPPSPVIPQTRIDTAGEIK